MLKRFLMVLIVSTEFCQAANDPQLRLHPEQGRAVAQIEGTVKDIDAAGQRLTVQDKANQQVTTQIGPDTRAMDNLDHQVKWTSLKPGDRVILYYDTREHHALQIDYQSDVSDAVLGTPKVEFR